MYVGIQYNTDMRCPDYKVKKFRSIKSALKWKHEGEFKFAFPAAANENILVHSQNWHRSIREIYELNYGFRLKKSEVTQLWNKRSRGSIYEESWNQCEVTLYTRNGVRYED
jgi:hypothetical protein